MEEKFSQNTCRGQTFNMNTKVEAVAHNMTWTYANFIHLHCHIPYTGNNRIPSTYFSKKNNNNKKSAHTKCEIEVKII